MARPKLQKSILSLKSWLFTPATKSDRFTRAADVHSDALIIDLEDTVAPSAKTEARETALRYLAGISADRLPCASRINSPDTRFGLDDLRALLNSPAKPDYLVLPKCDSSALIALVGNRPGASGVQGRAHGGSERHALDLRTSAIQGRLPC
jgi:(S)-citramalyl-CoA lyase